MQSSTGERAGKCKYSAWRLDKSGWHDIDQYALFLYRLCKENTRSFNGVFSSVMCSEDEKEQRMWQAMKRATMDRNKTLKAKEKAAARLRSQV